MTVRIWNAYSPNNSSSCRMVARFVDPRIAREMAAEIARFLIVHIRANRGHWHEDPSLTAFANKYDLDAAAVLDWTSHLRPDDEPEIAVDDGVLVVFHHYCLGFDDLKPVLQSRGGLVEVREYHAETRPTISALFRSTAEAERDLAIVFAHIDAQGSERPEFRAPWVAYTEPFVNAAYFRDAGTIGMWFPCEPHALPAFENWLAARGVERPSLRWCEYSDEKLFRAIAKARCTSCNGQVEYLDPRIHDIETPQFVCRACGGLYERTALT